MKRTYAWRDGALVELSAPQIEGLTNVQDDIQEFYSPDGVWISGKRQWREHLHRTGSVELNHTDIQNAKEVWGKRRDAFQAKLKGSESVVREAEAPQEIRPIERSRINAEVRNRLDGRPTPDRKTLIKLTLETARRYGGKR